MQEQVTSAPPPLADNNTHPSDSKGGSGRRALFALVLLLAAITAGYYWWRSAAAPSAQDQGRHGGNAGAVTVATGQVTTGDMAVALDGLGTVTSLATVTVKSQIAGKITEIGFTEGQAVKAGDFLIQIDPQPYQAALNQAQGQLARDEATLATTKVDLDRYTTLLKQDSIARQQVDTQRSLVKQTEAIVESDKAAVDAAKINLAYCRIVSPIAGRAGIRNVDLGNYVQASDTTGLVVITQTQPISVIFSLPEDSIPQFVNKLRAGETLPVKAFDRTGVTLLATGKLSSIDSQIDTTTGTVRLRAEFANEKEELFPNQFVNVTLVVDTQRNVTLIPAAGVQLGSPGSYAYLVNSDNTVSVKTLKLGPSDAQHAVVLEGLSPGDKVVVDGADRLREGAKVTVSSSHKADTGAASENTPPKMPRGQDASSASKPGKESDGAAAPNSNAPPNASQPVPDAKPDGHKHHHGDQPGGDPKSTK